MGLMRLFFPWGLILQAFAIAHFIRRRPDGYWLWIIILGGGLGVRLGEPYAARIAEAMQPHLFFSDRPPPLVVAALGDLGGAIGASLLTPG